MHPGNSSSRAAALARLNALLRGSAPLDLTTSPTRLELARRELLAAGAVSAAFFLLGCQSAKPRASASLPGATYPDQDLSPLPPVADLGGGESPVAPVTPPPGASKNYDLPPNVIARSTWTNAGVIRAKANPMNGVTRITVHHDAIPSTGIRSRADAVRRLNSVRQSHLREGWADIGYHYVIDPQGNVWEARPLYFQGAHVKDNNEHNLGVMCMGNFNQHRPTTAQTRTLDSFLATLMRRHNVALSRVRTHQEIMPTQCPGRNLQSYMLATRSRSGRLAQLA